MKSLFVLLALLAGCKLKESDTRRAQRQLGPSAVCSWKDDQTVNREIVCINNGNRYICMASNEHVACAVVNSTPAEGAR